MLPFNVEILILTNIQLMQLKEVKSLSIFEPASKNFHTDGLFSTDIFGPIGSSLRNDKFGYINLHVPVLHPVVFQDLCGLKSLYQDIMASKAYAKFDPVLKDFIKSDINEGDTGYNFFMKHINKIEFSDRNSDSRKFKIEMVEKYTIPSKLIDKWLVLPAGLREYVEDESGIPSEDEINAIYRKLMNASALLKNTSIDLEDLEALDMIRYRIQTIVVEIYEYIRSLLDGKNKFIQGKWTKRAIDFGTRNVITATPIHIPDLDDNNIVGFNHTVVGLYQYLAAINPIVKYWMNRTFISKIFPSDTSTVSLINSKSMKSEYVTISNKLRDLWTTEEGMNSLISKMGQEEQRSDPVKLGDYYLALLYDNGKEIRLILNTEYVDDSLDKKYIRPITYAEMFYIAIYDVRGKYPGFITRYPVAGIGGIYPSKLYLKTTTVGRTVTYYDDINASKEMLEYPIIGQSYYNSLSPHYTHLAKLVADFDGDMCSLSVVYTDESIAEIDKLLNSKEFYISPDGKLLYSAETDTIKLVLKHLTT